MLFSVLFQILLFPRYENRRHKTKQNNRLSRRRRCPFPAQSRHFESRPRALNVRRCIHTTRLQHPSNARYESSPDCNTACWCGPHHRTSRRHPHLLPPDSASRRRALPATTPPLKPSRLKSSCSKTPWRCTYSCTTTIVFPVPFACITYVVLLRPVLRQRSTFTSVCVPARACSYTTAVSFIILCHQ